MCNAAICPGGLRVREYDRDLIAPPDVWGPWTYVRTICLPYAVLAAAVVPPEVLAYNYFKHIPFTVPVIAVKPGLRGLAGLPSYFWLTGRYDLGGALSGSGVTVKVTARPEQFEWAFGDGSTMTTTSPGLPWPARSDIRHTYQRKGTEAVHVVAHWTGTYSVNDGPARPIPGAAVDTAATITYHVDELQTVLTG